jgi:hypothetical protein
MTQNYSRSEETQDGGTEKSAMAAGGAAEWNNQGERLPLE